MSERLPYEQHLNQQWTEVPLPNEDMAWADMKRRLEEDDDDGFFWWWRPGCGIIGLVLVMLGLGWWMLRDKEGKEQKEVKEVSELVVKDSVDKKNNGVDTSLLNTNESGSKVNDVTRGVEKQSAPETVKNKPAEKTQEQEATKKGDVRVETPKKQQPKATRTPEKSATRVSQKNQRPNRKNISGTVTQQRTKSPSAPERQKDISAEKPIDNNISTITDSAATETPIIDTAVTEPKKTAPVKKPATDSPTVKKPTPPDSSKQKSFFFSAGLSVQQQLPIAGQKATPYNSLGRKGSLLDYIPSVYVRLNRKDKWFLQAELKYGAPQYTKEFVYHQVVVPDSGTAPRFETTTSNQLKKSFYHQLPLTFNYFVKPNWSVGGGVQWNKFYGAVSDQEVIQHDNFNNTDSTISKGIVITKSDSSGAFEKSYFQAVLESQYRWKRFSFGARYTFGLTPYLTITLPNQPGKKEKNSNILVFLRYELWRQK